MKAYSMLFQPDQAAVTSQPEQLVLLGKAQVPMDSNAVIKAVDVFIARI